jgi:hypothetical protein
VISETRPNDFTTYWPVARQARCPSRVKTSKAQNEQMFSGLPPKADLRQYEVARPASPTQELGWRGKRLARPVVIPLANKDKREYGHRCDQQDGEHDGPNQRGKRSRLFVMVCHRRYSRRQHLPNAAIAASRDDS